MKTCFVDNSLILSSITCFHKSFIFCREKKYFIRVIVMSDLRAYRLYHWWTVVVLTTIVLMPLSCWTNYYLYKLSFNSLPTSFIYGWPLQTVWTQIRPDKMSGLIRIQTVWHSDDQYSWRNFRKSWFWKKSVKKNSRRQKKHEKLPRKLRVNLQWFHL